MQTVLLTRHYNTEKNIYMYLFLRNQNLCTATILQDKKQHQNGQISCLLDTAKTKNNHTFSVRPAEKYIGTLRFMRSQ